MTKFRFFSTSYMPEYYVCCWTYFIDNQISSYVHTGLEDYQSVYNLFN